ncbi:PstS family phosphate ABC transporter substrate-binding protein [Rhodanobacter terrae]|uniref:PstS family phosphate ABC transporter substrate-binding protein n=1 Tax=Rhodanobacter terrae TaxID=418647 RepID=A0ABW0T0N1_9GAMM
MKSISKPRIPCGHRACASIIASILACVVTSVVQASTGPTQVELLVSPAPKYAPQTPAQSDAGERTGRPLPTPEILQPTLDPTLPTFKPHYGHTLKGSLRMGSSDVLPGLVRSWIAGFERLYPDVHISFGPPYEGTHAEAEMDHGKIDIAFVSRELKPTDIATFAADHGYPPLSVPVSGGSYRQFGFLDAVGFFVNQANPVEHLSLTQLDQILSSSHLRGGSTAKTWGDVGVTGDWATHPIHVYAIKPWNGFEEFVRQRVLDVNGQRGHWRKDLHFDHLVFPVADGVAADPDGIGYAGLAFVDAPVKLISIGTEGQFVAPTYSNVATASYPLSRLIYANVNRKPGSAMNPALQEFLRFVLSRQGQQAVLSEAIFLPLREFQSNPARSLIAPTSPGLHP